MVKGVRGIKPLVVKTASLAHPLAEQENGFSVGREPVRANNMKNDAKIRQDLMSLKCFLFLRTHFLPHPSPLLLGEGITDTWFIFEKIIFLKV